MVAHKFFDESCYKTEFYAYLSSMNISELNTVERNFLRELGFSLFVSQDEYINQYSALKAIVSSLCGGKSELEGSREEKVILPALIKVSDSHGVSSLQYQSYPQDTVCQYHYEQWKQQSLMFIPPIIPVPVTIAVASVPVYSASCIHSYNCNPVSTIQKHQTVSTPDENISTRDSFIGIKTQPYFSVCIPTYSNSINYCPLSQQAMRLFSCSQSNYTFYPQSFPFVVVPILRNSYPAGCFSVQRPCSY
ncbi:hypothetical protein JH06_3759 [Blastocystis sp. subtype 4]|jgi:hypothetical protein|uniref:hypothetical protein n=1 Tax=Blastocystis sp. subtype 4 TaxID=944170 RepID=UPI000711E9DE|nr:hypothetical protein JH06_3759 [Blastocystis sp. subtype 4]KNB43046.1 hypothetical protein JH06_3759 [Blastocystis sp. subtype 4]|eukprot:XP_014526489.1 hypothetical protein JH06_3759 [Blastocystis sp. subtype 4]